jgi:hypothetical protein
VVVLDQVFVNGKLEEGTFDWYAQDRDGNIWYFGEDSKTYDGNGNVTSTEGSWEAGVNGAQPGIIMEATPQVGDSYRQEYLQGEAEDRAAVESISESISVKAGSFTDVLDTREWYDLEPAAVEHKYYVKGKGLILVTTPDESERLELVEIKQ